MSLFASFDLELPDDPDFLALEQLNPAWPWWWMRLVQAAKRFNRGGRVCNADGRPVRARGLAMIHHRSPAREQEWAEMLDACVELGLLTDEGGEYRIAHWRRWHRSPSDEPEAVRDRVARHRAATRDTAPVTGGNEGVTDGNGCNETEQSRAEHSIDPPPTPSAEGDEEEAPASQPDLPPAPDWTPRGNGLDALKPILGAVMQQQGILGNPDGRWWTSFSEWAHGPLESGQATLDDIRDALAFCRDAARHHRPKPGWPGWCWMMTCAAGELGNIAQRNAARRRWEERGRKGAEPLPYVFHPPEPRGSPDAALPVTSREALVRGGGRC